MPEKKQRRVRRATTGLLLYIAIAITVLGIAVLSTIGTNDSQNQKIAQQARELARLNCHHMNYVRLKVNTVSGALTSLLRKSVAEAERKKPLTPGQETFLKHEYRMLRPLHLIPCMGAHMHMGPTDTGGP